MNKKVPLFMVVDSVLVVLMLLFLYFGYLKHQREKELALEVRPESRFLAGLLEGAARPILILLGF